MHQAFPEALVEAHASVAALKFALPDANDEHVLAAAVQTQAQAVVTENINDFCGGDSWAVQHPSADRRRVHRRHHRAR